MPMVSPIRTSHVPAARDRSRNARGVAGRHIALWLATLMLGAGCGTDEIETAYGKRRGYPGAESVNGTSVLAAMFEAKGHRVSTWRRLSPKLFEADTLVWIPDDFDLPTEEEREFLETWLSDTNPGSTLIYVGRDYDAGPEYWARVAPQAPPEQKLEVARRRASLQAEYDSKRASLPAREAADWFVVDNERPHREVRTLSGPWAEGIDAAQVEIELNSRFLPPGDVEQQMWRDRDWRWSGDDAAVETLLASENEPLVMRVTHEEWGGSQIILVTNGSFLLNLPLVNHEHRKLAARLIDLCPPGGRVVFLESAVGGLPVFDEEPGADAPTGFEVFTVWPLGVILIHLSALGILACFAMFPVFGRPKELPRPNAADFGQHVTALGELLEQTGDREYALSRIQQYQDLVSPDPQKRSAPASRR